MTKLFDISTLLGDIAQHEHHPVDDGVLAEILRGQFVPPAAVSDDLIG